ncbi:MAG: hypothetical protein ACWA40_00375 [Planktomarina sp.]
MRYFITFFAGAFAAFLGMQAIAAAKQVYQTVDDGVTFTHMSDEMERLQHESDLLRDAALDMSLGQSMAQVTDLLTNNGWSSFPKPSENALYATKENKRTQIGFIFENDRLIWITNHCEVFHADETCRQETE